MRGVALLDLLIRIKDASLDTVRRIEQRLRAAGCSARTRRAASHHRAERQIAYRPSIG